MFCVGSAAQYFLVLQMGKSESVMVPVLGTVFGLMFSINLVGGISGEQWWMFFSRLCFMYFS